MTAGVTTGAFYKHFSSKESLFEELVQPYIDELVNMYDKELSEFLNTLENLDLEKRWKGDFYELDSFINYVFENKRIFNLVLFKSAGSKYQDIVEQATIFVTKKTLYCIEKLKIAGKANQNLILEEEELHFYIYSFYAAFCDILRHNYSREKTLFLTRKLYRFAVPGWIELLS